jgi:hypothetical protein
MVCADADFEFHLLCNTRGGRPSYWSLFVVGLGLGGEIRGELCSVAVVVVGVLVLEEEISNGSPFTHRRVT